MKSLPQFSVENHVLVNLLMLAMIVGGAYAAVTLIREMFPESRPNQILISTPYPGATPAEIEKGITKRIEEEVKDVEGVDKIESRVTEGLSMVIVSLDNSVDDVDVSVDELQTRIDSIPRDELPEDAEETIVIKLEPKLPVIAVALFGDVGESELKDSARALRDDLLRIPGISDVQINGTRKDEIVVEVEPERLIEYGLSITEVAEAIRGTNLELPAGQIKTAGERVAVRTLGETDETTLIAQTVIRADPMGQAIRVSDVGRVIDAFEDSDTRGRFNGYPSAGVVVYKTADQDAVDISTKVRAYVAGREGKPVEWDWLTKLKNAFGARTPQQEVYEQALTQARVSQGASDLMGTMTHSDLARFIEGRLDLLTRNGMWGLLFVFCSLFFFLNWRVALWVMTGLLVAVGGSVIVMHWVGATLNLISMFGLIVVLGMLVDDAIVVGENIFSRIERGEAPRLAAVKGTEEVMWPVVVTVTTTIGAFVPLLFIEGQIGDFMGVLPVVVTVALSVSLLEALVILPCHLADSLKPAPARGSAATLRGPMGWLRRARERQRVWLEWFTEHVYGRVLHNCVSYRYATVAAAVAGLLMAGGLVAGKHVPFVFVQDTDSDILIADLKMPIGTPVAATEAVIRQLEREVLDVPEVRSAFSMVGISSEAGGDGSAASFTAQSHIGQLLIELIESENRGRHSDRIIADFRAKTAGLEGINSLTFSTIGGGPGGKPIEIQVMGDQLEPLLAASEMLKSKLSGFRGVYDITDDFDEGRREIQLELLDSSRAVGLTNEMLAMQIRGAFYGLEARTLQRGGEDVDIRVRFPEGRRTKVEELDQMRVATPTGALVPLTEVARLKDAQGFTSVRRVDQRRAVIVAADVDDDENNADAILAELAPFCRELEWSHPGVLVSYEGNHRETAKAFGSLRRDFLIALAVIFVMLAGLFRSYIQPVIVMSAIPFGIIGAVFGHWVLGYPLTILSTIGLVALSGIVVNDSLILVDFVNKETAGGMPTLPAVVEGGKRRLRAILLTSITTILGIAPMMAEQSFQAKFLIPMAISITFGLAFATLLTLIIVPCLYLIVDDVRRVGLRVWHGPSWAPAPGPVH